MEKVVEFSKTVYELCSQDPDIINIMKEIGFENIASKAMLNTAGRVMTIPKGAAMKGLDLSKIRDTFIGKGYRVIE